MNVLDFVENELLTCLCQRLADEGRPVCACQHYAGESQPPADRCGNEAGSNGQAWIRRGPSQVEHNTERMTLGGVPCGNGEWITTIELGIYRCLTAIPDERGRPPAVEAYAADRELIMADRATLATVLCCWPLAGEPPAPVDFDLVLTVLSAQIVSTDPQGACSGSVLTITLRTALEAEEGQPPGDDEDEDEAVDGAAIGWFVSRPAGGG